VVSELIQQATGLKSKAEALQKRRSALLLKRQDVEKREGQVAILRQQADVLEKTLAGLHAQAAALREEATTEISKRATEVQVAMSGLVSLRKGSLGQYGEWMAPEQRAAFQQRMDDLLLRFDDVWGRLAPRSSIQARELGVDLVALREETAALGTEAERLHSEARTRQEGEILRLGSRIDETLAAAQRHMPLLQSTQPLRGWAAEREWVALEQATSASAKKLQGLVRPSQSLTPAQAADLDREISLVANVIPSVGDRLEAFARLCQQRRDAAIALVQRETEEQSRAVAGLQDALEETARQQAEWLPREDMQPLREQAQGLYAFLGQTMRETPPSQRTADDLLGKLRAFPDQAKTIGSAIGKLQEEADQRRTEVIARLRQQSAEMGEMLQTLGQELAALSTLPLISEVQGQSALQAAYAAHQQDWTSFSSRSEAPTPSKADELAQEQRALRPALQKTLAQARELRQTTLARWLSQEAERLSKEFEDLTKTLGIAVEQSAGWLLQGQAEQVSGQLGDHRALLASLLQTAQTPSEVVQKVADPQQTIRWLRQAKDALSQRIADLRQQAQERQQAEKARLQGPQNEVGEKLQNLSDGLVALEQVETWLLPGQWQDVQTRGNSCEAQMSALASAIGEPSLPYASVASLDGQLNELQRLVIGVGQAVEICQNEALARSKEAKETLRHEASRLFGALSGLKDLAEPATRMARAWLPADRLDRLELDLETQRSKSQTIAQAEPAGRDDAERLSADLAEVKQSSQELEGRVGQLLKEVEDRRERELENLEHLKAEASAGVQHFEQALAALAMEQGWLLEGQWEEVQPLAARCQGQLDAVSPIPQVLTHANLEALKQAFSSLHKETQEAGIRVQQLQHDAVTRRDDFRSSLRQGGLPCGETLSGLTKKLITLKQELSNWLPQSPLQTVQQQLEFAQRSHQEIAQAVPESFARATELLGKLKTLETQGQDIHRQLEDVEKEAKQRIAAEKLRLQAQLDEGAQNTSAMLQRVSELEQKRRYLQQASDQATLQAAVSRYAEQLQRLREQRNKAQPLDLVNLAQSVVPLFRRMSDTAQQIEGLHLLADDRRRMEVARVQQKADVAQTKLSAFLQQINTLEEMSGWLETWEWEGLGPEAQECTGRLQELRSQISAPGANLEMLGQELDALRQRIDDASQDATKRVQRAEEQRKNGAEELMRAAARYVRTISDVQRALTQAQEGFPEWPSLEGSREIQSGLDGLNTLIQRAQELPKSNAQVADLLDDLRRIPDEAKKLQTAIANLWQKALAAVRARLQKLADATSENVNSLGNEVRTLADNRAYLPAGALDQLQPQAVAFDAPLRSMLQAIATATPTNAVRLEGNLSALLKGATDARQRVEVLQRQADGLKPANRTFSVPLFKDMLQTIMDTIRQNRDLPLDVVQTNVRYAMFAFLGPDQYEAMLKVVSFEVAPHLNEIQLSLVLNRRDELVALLGAQNTAFAQAVGTARRQQSPEDFLALLNRFTSTPADPALPAKTGVTAQNREGQQNRDVEELYRYNLADRLGMGGSAEVFEATDTSSSASVALRVPLLRRPNPRRMDTLHTRFLEEASGWFKLTNPKVGSPNLHIVRLYAFGTTPYPWMAMELMEGYDLRERLARELLATMPEKLEVATQLCDALGYAHRLAILHRDIKPENVLFTNTGVPKLSDWGSARPFAVLSANASYQGTEAYASPEELQHPGNASYRSDVFQMGVLLYELFTGRYPWSSDGNLPTDRSFLDRIIDPTWSPPAPSNYAQGISSDLARTIARAMSKDPRSRYVNGEAMAEDLRDVRPAT